MEARYILFFGLTMNIQCLEYVNCYFTGCPYTDDSKIFGRKGQGMPDNLLPFRLVLDMVNSMLIDKMSL